VTGYGPDSQNSLLGWSRMIRRVQPRGAPSIQFTHELKANVIPYLRVYKPHSFDKNFSSKIGVRLFTEFKKIT
jgi:hypothetical protein